LKEEVVCEFLQEQQQRWRQRGGLKTTREQQEAISEGLCVQGNAVDC
jgi:hypothetical protein